MSPRTQAEKATDFLKLHHDPRLLVLPNIWDPLGARLLERLGFPAVATASAAVAFSHGYRDGEKIGFPAMLEVIRRIAHSVDVPVTADIESGYSPTPEGVAGNVREILDAGAVGVNIEDALPDAGGLLPVEQQCERLRAARDAAEAKGVHLVINARTDVFYRDIRGSKEKNLAETIERAKAYLDAGADCIYPIVVGDLATLKIIKEETGAPLNVYASAATAPMRELEAAGISRLSIGPGLLRASVTAMKAAAEELQSYGSYDRFTKDAVTSPEIVRLVAGRAQHRG